MAKNPVYHSCTRHIALKHHFLIEAIEEGKIQVEYYNSNDQVADISRRQYTFKGEKYQY